MGNGAGVFWPERMELQMEDRMGGTGGWLILGWSGFIFCSKLFWRSKDVLFFFFFEYLPPEKRKTTTKSLESIYIKKTLQFFEHELTCEVMNCPFCGGKMENCRHRYEGIPRGRSHGSMPSCELMKSGSLRQCELFYWWVKRTKINVVEW